MSESYSDVTSECPVCLRTFSSLIRGFCTECYGDTLDYGTKWNGERYGVIFIRDPLYCMGIFAKQWKPTEGSKKFRKWLISASKLNSLATECSNDLIVNGKMEHRTFIDVLDNEESYCHYIRNNTINNKNLRDFKSYLVLAEFLENLELYKDF